MRLSSSIRAGIVILLCGALCAAATQASATTSKKKSTTTSSTSTKSSAKSATHRKSRGKTKKTAKSRGQKAIESERAQQIQEALIRQHYMDGEPSGKWDEATQAALRRYQADQGWQSKSVPDSRALIKLGLGPSHDHLLNPETAMTTAPNAGERVSKPAATKPPVQTSPDATPQQ